MKWRPGQDSSNAIFHPKPAFWAIRKQGMNIRNQMISDRAARGFGFSIESSPWVDCLRLSANNEDHLAKITFDHLSHIKPSESYSPPSWAISLVAARASVRRAVTATWTVCSSIVVMLTVTRKCAYRSTHWQNEAKNSHYLFHHVSRCVIVLPNGEITLRLRHKIINKIYKNIPSRRRVSQVLVKIHKKVADWKSHFRHSGRRVGWFLPLVID